MTRLIVATIVLLLSAPALAGSCRFSQREVLEDGTVERATKERKLKGEPEGESVPLKLEVAAHRKGQSIQLEFVLTSRAEELPDQAEPDRQVVVVTADGEEHTLWPATDVLGAPSGGKKVTISELFRVPLAAVAPLKGGEIRAIRYRGAWHAFELEPEDPALVGEAVACLYE